MKTTFKEYALPRYNAFVLGMKLQAEKEGVKFVVPSFTDYLSAAAKSWVQPDDTSEKCTTK
jgi:hypothetical protein